MRFRAAICDSGQKGILCIFSEPFYQKKIKKIQKLFNCFEEPFGGFENKVITKVDFQEVKIGVDITHVRRWKLICPHCNCERSYV